MFIYTDPSQLPKLSDEFQTRVEINMYTSSQTAEALILFDANDRRGEIFTRKADKTSRRKIFYFDRNQVFTIQSKISAALA